MSDTLAALRQEIMDEVLARVNAKLAQYEAEAVAKVEEPPMLTEGVLQALEIGRYADYRIGLHASARLRYVEPELSRLRKQVAELERAQERHVGDLADSTIQFYGTLNPGRVMWNEADRSIYMRGFDELARRRGLKVAAR